MIYYMCASVAILLTGIWLAAKNKNNLRKVSVTLTAAISFAISALVFPYFHLGQSDLLIAILKDIRYGPSAVTMSVNADIVSALGLTSPMKEIFMFYLYNLYIAGPLCASLFLLSFSRTVAEWLRIRKYRKAHVFSRLDSRTLAIARSIAASGRKEILIFCGCDEKNESPLAPEARTIHALLLNKKIRNLKLMKGFSNEFYIFSDSVLESISDTAALCEKLMNEPEDIRTRMTVRYIADYRYIELIRSLDAKYGDKIQLRFIDEENAEALHVLRQCRPSLIREGHHEVMIFGNTDASLALFRSLICLLITPESTWRIHLFDPHAKKTAAMLKQRCPELLNAPLDEYLGFQSEDGMNYPLHFHEYDPDSSEMLETLRKLPVPDMLFVTYADDGVNFITARTLKRFYGSLSDNLQVPKITCLVREPRLNRILDPEEFHYYGNVDERFSYDKIVRPEIAESAERVHLSYLGNEYRSLMNEDSPKRQKVLEDTGFFRYVNYDSSFAMALALEYRAARILRDKPEGEKDEDFINRWLEDETNLCLLGDYEHLRWNAYQRLQGWRTASPAQEKMIAEKTGGKKVKDDDLLLHPAITSVEDLPGAEMLADAILSEVSGTEKHTRYVELDRVILKDMTNILNIT